MSNPSAGPSKASARKPEYTSRNIDESKAVWLPREIEIGERVGLRVWMVGFLLDTGRAIIRTERRPAGGGNRLNSGRYRMHVARSEEMGTACLANAIARMDRAAAAKGEQSGQEDGKASQGRVAAGDGGALEFLDTLATAIECGVEYSKKQAATLAADSQEEPATTSGASASAETAGHKSGNDDSGGPGAGSGASPDWTGEPPTVFLDYPVEGGDKTNAQFLIDTVNKAVKKRWDISPDMKDAVVNSLSALMVNELSRKPEAGGPDPKILLGVCRTVALLEKQNQTDELKITPSLHLHATQPNEQRTVKPAEVRASIVSAVIAELRKRNIAGRRDDDGDNPGSNTVDGGGTGGDGGGDGAAAAG